jgi:prepilin-type N-terminal cleavage/methylation domain-containing protein
LIIPVTSQHRQYELPARRSGFTLIEVMLSLGLAALVLMALATAVDVHLRCVQVGRTHVEEAQLARAILHRIADDLRNAAVVNPIETEGIMAAAEEASSEEGGVGGTGDTGGTGTDDESEMSMFESDLEEEEYVLGIYGESDWMQVDVCRTPRLDHYNYETLPTGSDALEDIVSEVKTVCYSLSTETGMTATSGEYEGGLVRREIDRSVSNWAEEMGVLSQVDLDLEPIAPEVVDLEFLYHDGIEWVTTWDSTEMGGLPIAVHISIAVVPRGQLDQFTDTWADQSALTEPSTTFLYSLTVALPVAEGDTSADETTEEAEEPEEEL